MSNSSTITVIPITKNTAPKETSCCLMLVTFIFQLEKEKHKPLNRNLCGPVKYGSCLIRKEEKGNSVFETIIFTSVSLKENKIKILQF